MLISYNTELLQDICFNSSVAIKYLGKEAATSLQARHADIQAADNIYELPFGTPSIDNHLCKLVIPKILLISMVPNYVVDSDEIYDWATVRRVKFVGINNVT